jgi:hypothetical protein
MTMTKMAKGSRRDPLASVTVVMVMMTGKVTESSHVAPLKKKKRKKEERERREGAHYGNIESLDFHNYNHNNHNHNRNNTVTVMIIITDLIGIGILTQ